MRSIVRLGVVREFDGSTGLGTVRNVDGDDYLFHCVEIADGRRAIEVGTMVTFVVLKKLGLDEAAMIMPVSPHGTA